MGKRAWATAIVVCGVLLVILMAGAQTHLDLAEPPRATASWSAAQATTLSPTPTAVGQPGMGETEGSRLYLSVMGAIIFVLVAIPTGFVAFLFLRWLWGMRHSRVRVAAARRRSTATQGDLVFTDDERAEVAETLTVSLARLRAGDDLGEAIVEAWRTLEAVAARRGLVRDPAQTAGDYAVDLLAHTGADEADLRALADLYRAAWYSQRTPTAADRDHAVDVVARLVDAIAPGIRP